MRRLAYLQVTCKQPGEFFVKGQVYDMSVKIGWTGKVRLTKLQGFYYAEPKENERDIKDMETFFKMFTIDKVLEDPNMPSPGQIFGGPSEPAV